MHVQGSCPCQLPVSLPDGWPTMGWPTQGWPTQGWPSLPALPCLLLQDQLGSCALLEACKYGHDGVLAQLRAAGASLDGSKSSVEQAAVLCTAVFDGDLPLLRRLILSGVAVNSGDYGGWTGLAKFVWWLQSLTACQLVPKQPVSRPPMPLLPSCRQAHRAAHQRGGGQPAGGATAGRGGWRQPRDCRPLGPHAAR